MYCEKNIVKSDIDSHVSSNSKAISFSEKTIIANLVLSIKSSSHHLFIHKIDFNSLQLMNSNIL